MSGDITINEHIKSIKEIITELSAIGDKLTEEDQVIRLLTSLPDSYDVLVTALEANDSTPTWSHTVERLLHQEKSKKRKEKSKKL